MVLYLRIRPEDVFCGMCGEVCMKTVILFEDDDDKMESYVTDVLHDIGIEVKNSHCMEKLIPKTVIDFAVCDFSHHNRRVNQSVDALRRTHKETQIIAIVDEDQNLEGLHSDDIILQKPFNAVQLLTSVDFGDGNSQAS